MAMGLTMGLNFLLLVAMVSTNILSLYHLSSTTSFFQPKPHIPTPPHVPQHLLDHLNTIRATIDRLTRSHAPLTKTPRATSSDLLTFSTISPIASSCHDHPDLLHKYMSYTPFSTCPRDTHLAETLILRGCHPLPRRRCFTKTPPAFDSNVIWDSYNFTSCKSFKCLDHKLGFDFSKTEEQMFISYKSELDLTISQLFSIAKKANFVIRLGIDIGGGTGTFGVKMREKNVTIMTTTMNLGAPYSEANAIRGLLTLHAPLQQRLPVFDGVLDLVRCGHAVNRWIPVRVMEFLFYDVDRVLRAGGFLWVDHFFSKGSDLEKVYKPLISKLGYKVVKWATGNKTDSSGAKNGEMYLTALLQKPNSR